MEVPELINDAVPALHNSVGCRLQEIGNIRERDKGSPEQHLSFLAAHGDSLLLVSARPVFLDKEIVTWTSESDEFAAQP